MSIFGKILKFSAVLVVLGAFAWLGAQLFFPDKYEKYALPYLNKYFVQVSDDTRQISQKEKIIIAFAQDVPELEPTSADPNARNRLLQIYEPLVQLNRFLEPEPALAISRGQIDDRTWEFTIRPNVKFHNSKLLTTEDVIASIDRAKNFHKSQLKNLVGSFDVKISEKNNNRITVITPFPDPLILQKLSFVLIMPKDYADDDIPKLVGTGPYKYLNWTRGEEMNFTRNENYWGDPPSAKSLKIKIVPDRESRVKALTSHEIDVLADVPPTYIERLDKARVSVKTMPSFEVAFLLFNMKSQVFTDKNLREAVAMAIDKKRFMLSSFGYTKEVSQFVSSGVFGFNQNIKPLPYSPDKAAETVSSISEFQNIPIKFAVPEGMVETGKDIVGMLKQIGFSVTFIAYKDFVGAMKDDSIDLHLMGWKSDISDAQDFVQSVVRTKDEKKSLGMYNIGRYSNAGVDGMIDSAMRESNPGKRLKTLHEIMRIITEDHIIGVPLFETQIIYGVAEGVDFMPRADGYILAKDIS